MHDRIGHASTPKVEPPFKMGLIRQMEPVVIWGASGHARVVCDAIRLRGRFEVAGFIDGLNPQRKGELFEWAPVLGGPEELPALRIAGITNIIIAFGHCLGRLSAAAEADSLGFQFITVAHPSATIATDVTIGDGSFVAAGAVINPGAKIGKHVIVNTCASVDHDTRLDDGVHVAPGARLAGTVTVGRGAFVGMGSCVKEHTCVGAGAVVGAGTVVLKDVPEGCTVVGNPGRILRTKGAELRR